MSGSDPQVIEWTGDLDDDCTAIWSGLMLRAEWMDGDRWWWPVSDLESGDQIDSSSNDGYWGIAFISGGIARNAAEKAAREHVRRKSR